MSNLQINPVNQPTFQADALLEGTEIVVRFSGTADLTAKAMMDAFLRAVHEEATRIYITQVNVDVSGLEFINSSCLMAIVSWITGVQAMARRYQISFHFKSIRDWHRRSLAVLSQLGAGFVSIQPVPEPAPAAEVEDPDAKLEQTRMIKPRHP
ncbi:MAG TPA: hypothetical protein VFH73_09615 [Polyangia bacterium]|nr:hypothetical protein [Polyangia bacterium]